MQASSNSGTRGGTQFFSGRPRGVRPRFPKCGASNWHFLPQSEKGGLWAKNFQICGLVSWKFPNLGACELKISKFGDLWAKIWVKIEAVKAKISQKGVLWTLNWLFCLKWDPCKRQERHEKGVFARVFRAAHHTPFSVALERYSEAKKIIRNMYLWDWGTSDHNNCKFIVALEPKWLRTGPWTWWKHWSLPSIMSIHDILLVLPHTCIVVAFGSVSSDIQWWHFDCDFLHQTSL